MIQRDINWKHLEDVCRDCISLGKRKNADYGTDNITDCGIQGIVVRLRDKTSRLKTLLLENKPQEVNDENIRDTLMDTINYCLYGIALLDGNFLLHETPAPNQCGKKTSVSFVKDSELET